MQFFAQFILALAIISTSQGAATNDWLVSPSIPTASTVVNRCWTNDYDRPTGSKQLCGLEISNGLVARRFVTSPAFGTIDYLVNGTARFGGTQSLFRSVMPEGTITLDERTYTIGGLEIASFRSEFFLAYANRTEMILQAPSERTHLLYGASGNFAYVNHSTGPITAPFRWTSGKRGSPSSLNWPPKGIQLVVNFRTAQTTEHRDFLLTVTYELYDGAPVLSKRVSLSYAPTDNSRTTVHRTPLHSPSPKTYRRLRTGKPPSKQTDIEGWDAPVNGVLAFVSAKRGLCLNNTAGTGNEVAQTVYGQHETSVSLSIAGCVPEVHPTAWCATPPTPAISSMRDDIHGGVVLGFTSKKGQLVSALALDELDYWMQWTFSNDGRVTMGQGNSTPSHVGQANDVGDRLSLSLEGSRFAGFVNGVAMGWLAAGSTSGLRPVVQVLSYGEHHNPYPNACNLKPTTDSPSPSPTPPSPHPSPAPTPTPPTSSAVVNQVVVDLLAANAGAGHYLTHGSRPPEWNYNDGGTGSGALPSLLQASSDQSFGAACRWRDQMPQSVDHIPGCAGCSDEGAVEPYLNCSYTSPPGVTVDGTSSFQSFKAIETAMDSFDPTRQVLTRARVGEILTPWTLENPLTFRTSGKNFTAAVDQMAEVGFELLGFNFQTSQIEDLNPENTAAIKAKVDYAKSKGIEVGGYDLIVLDRSTFTDSSGKVVPLPQNMSTQPRGSACMASAWFEYISSTLHQFIDATGLSMLDTDGAYSGEKCSATNHSHHHNEADSVHMQTKYQGIFYNKMREKGVYLASANNYFYQGSQVTGMGYNEQQFSLPRWRDLTVSRQTMYDDLYSLRPTQGHMLIPLTDYHAGASAAAFVGHAHAYEWALAQYFGAGLTNTQVGGDTLYMDASTHDVIRKWTSFAKRHRQTLIQPIVHLRRATGQSWDGFLHPHPRATAGNNASDGGGAEVGLAMLFNPTHRVLEETVALPLYYTGLTDAVSVQVNDEAPVKMHVERDYFLLLPMRMEPVSVNTVVLTVV